MLEGYIQELMQGELAMRFLIERDCDLVIQNLPNSRSVAMNLIKPWPVRCLVVGQSAADRINTEGEQTVQVWLESFQAQAAFAQQIPVEGLEVPDVKNNPVSLGNWTLVKRICF